MSKTEYKIVPLAQVEPDPTQPRQEFDPQALLRLKNNIAQYGVLNPLIVEQHGGKLLIVDGERRYRASKSLGLKEVPVLIRDKKDARSRLAERFSLQEQHVGWSTFEKANAVIDLMHSTGMNTSQIGKELGLSPATINDYLAIVQLSNRTRQYAVEKKLPVSYLTHLGRTLKQVEGMGLKNKLEQAVLARIESGAITTFKQIADFKSAIAAGGEEIAEKIVKNSEYTPKQALKESNRESEIFYASIKASANHLVRLIQSGMQGGAHKKFTKDGYADIERAIKYMRKYLEHAEFKDEE